MASEQYYAKSSLLRAHRRGWHYNEALRLLYSDKYVDNELVLAACILFWIHDNIMGDARAALVHLRGLLQMVGESKARKMAKGQRAPYLEIAIVHGLSYWGHSVDKALVDKPDPEVIAKIRDRLQDPDYSAKLYSYRTVRDEISLFSTATQWTCSDSGHESCASHEHSVTLEELEAFVHKWYSCVLRGECLLTNDDRISVECHYKTTLFIIKSQRKISAGTTRARLTEPEDRALFEDILQKIESISTNSLSQTPAGRDLVMPLCPIVAEIGRYASDDELMSRSLAAMRNMKRLEGFWNTAVVAALLEILWQQERFSEERLTAEKVTFAVDVLKETQS
ncbi:hypothetical protein LTR05_005594 [Lithohypha guttulata]|uniref:Uncharacterized protein n=1 Tax=Lithohypha guttulata TaxID=1690604 RepID=A0AAN7SYF5_9EURO|nr:hypothetical protein LTR05_005594 [Lithohypha guttulata]